MSKKDMFMIFIEYHVDMTRRVWDSIDQIAEQQFLADDDYSRGSIRNLMVHLINTDANWLTGLKNIPEDQDAQGKNTKTILTGPVCERIGRKLPETSRIMLRT